MFIYLFNFCVCVKCLQCKFNAQTYMQQAFTVALFSVVGCLGTFNLSGFEKKKMSNLSSITNKKCDSFSIRKLNVQMFRFGRANFSNLINNSALANVDSISLQAILLSIYTIFFFGIQT